MENEYNKREKTNSITHLVKIVANEEIEKAEKRIMALVENKIKERPVFFESLTNRYDKMIDDVMNLTEKAGLPWSNEEDSLLRVELRTALAQIAKNHGRTEGAISARIEHKGLVK